MGPPVGQVAQVCDRVAEAVAAVIALLVAAAGVDDLLVFLHLGVDVLHEGGVDLEDGEDGVAVDAVGLDLAEDLEGVVDGFRMVREQGPHLLLALEVLLLGIAEAVRVVDVGVGRQADQPVVDGAVLLADEVGVVGGDDLDPVLLRQLEDDGNILALTLIHILRAAGNLRLVEHDLEVIVVAEDLLVPLDRPVGGLHVAREDVPGNLARHAGGGADEPLVVLLQDFMVHARLVVHALELPQRDDLHQVPVPVVVLGQEDEVVVLAVVVVLEGVVVVLRDIDLAADDRLDPGMLRRILEELLDAEHVAVVRDGKAGHAELFGAVEQVLDRRLSVEDGVLGMYVQVDESHISGGVSRPAVRGGAG